MKLQWIAVGLAVAVMTGVAASSAGAKEGSVFGKYEQKGGVAESSRGVIAAGNREAALAGLKILDNGGNAVDAAAATVFAIGVAQFDSCGIGGGGFMVYRSASGEVDTLDFREWSPANYTFTDGFGIDKDTYAWGGGHNVVGIPGVVRGLDMALREHGTRPLRQPALDGRINVLDPAIDLASNGFTVSKPVADYIRDPLVAARLAVFPATAAIYLGAPEYYDSGQKMRNLPLAEDMQELKRLGAAAFYDPDLVGGTIADDLLAEMNRPSPYYNDQAKWGTDAQNVHDLTGYQAISRPAVTTRYRGAEYVGMAAPSSAGTATAQVLNILEGYDLRAAGQSSADHVHLFAEAMKLAWRDRAEYLGDPAYTPTPASLTSKEYADVLRAQIDPDNAQAFPAPDPAEGANTHNIAVIDKWGNAVALNCSIEQPMGSGVTAVGTGFLLNNQLTDFESPPSYAAPPGAATDAVDGPPRDPDGPANGWAPRKRPRSSMAPSIVVRHGVPVLVTGGIGGPGIIAPTTAAVLNVVDFGQDVAHAIDAERADPRGRCPNDDGLQLCVETTRFADGVLKDLRARGHRVMPSSAAPWTPCFGIGECEYAAWPLTHSAGVDPATGRRQAASDPRLFAADPATKTGLAAVAQSDGG
ncbi:MAG: gamma-glutamyltransferase [Actinomycetota bacterium]|nr:gamma-glutamyltransferase [Actinomycetota bacterium]